MSARRTRQLAAIEEALCSTADHPTAAEIHARVRHAIPRVSLGTIYRNLEKLIAAGRAIPVRLDGEVTRYDGMVARHDHFVCERCGKITDLADETAAAVDTQCLADAGYTVRSHSLALFGLCRQCGYVGVRRGHRRSTGRAAPPAPMRRPMRGSPRSR